VDFDAQLLAMVGEV